MMEHPIDYELAVRFAMERIEDEREKLLFLEDTLRCGAHSILEDWPMFDNFCRSNYGRRPDGGAA